MEFEHVTFDLPHGTFHMLQGGDPDGQPTLVLHGFPDHPPTATLFPAELGCPVAALGSDATRQSADVKASFEPGIKEYIEMLSPWIGEANGKDSSGKAMANLSTIVGAVLLSRAVNDQRLSKQFLKAAAESVLTTSSASGAQQGPLQ
jgi:hypothetical protein